MEFLISVIQFFNFRLILPGQILHVAVYFSGHQLCLVIPVFTSPVGLKLILTRGSASWCAWEFLIECWTFIIVTGDVSFLRRFHQPVSSWSETEAGLQSERLGYFSPWPRTFHVCFCIGRSWTPKVTSPAPRASQKLSSFFLLSSSVSSPSLIKNRQALWGESRCRV